MNQQNHRGRRMRIAVLGAVLTVLALLSSAQGSGVTPTYVWMDIYGSHSTFAGIPIPVDSYVAVNDPQGAQCGERVVATPGQIAPVMPCYGDDTLTTADEGAVQGDLLRFSINGSLATPQPRAKNFKPVAANTPVKWQALDVWEIDLYVPPKPLVTISHLPATTQLGWQPVEGAVSLYQVWRSTDFYFIPGAAGSELKGTAPAASAPLIWPDTEGVGNPTLNYAYRVVSLNTAGKTIGVSQAVAEFDFALYR